jgi:hypothetical protein
MESASAIHRLQENLGFLGENYCKIFPWSWVTMEIVRPIKASSIMESV